jgi:primosomal protein N'
MSVSDWSVRKASVQLWVIVALVFLFFSWAYFAQFDQIISSEGRLIVDSKLQVAQHLEGGIVKKIHTDKPEFYQVKPVRSLLDKEPIVTETQLKFWEWMASYYMCTEGDVMNAALPAHLKLVSETFVVLNDDVEIDMQSLSDDE